MKPRGAAGLEYPAPNLTCSTLHTPQPPDSSRRVLWKSAALVRTPYECGIRPRLVPNAVLNSALGLKRFIRRLAGHASHNSTNFVFTEKVAVPPLLDFRFCTSFRLTLSFLRSCPCANDGELGWTGEKEEGDVASMICVVCFFGVDRTRMVDTTRAGRDGSLLIATLRKRVLGPHDHSTCKHLDDYTTRTRRLHFQAENS